MPAYSNQGRLRYRSITAGCRNLIVLRTVEMDVPSAKIEIEGALAIELGITLVSRRDADIRRRVRRSRSSHSAREGTALPSGRICRERRRRRWGRDRQVLRGERRGCEEDGCGCSAKEHA